MRVLLIHREGPGQFAPLAEALQAGRPGGVVLVSGRAVPGAAYPVALAEPAAGDAGHPYLRPLEAAVRAGQASGRAVRGLVARGFSPDVVLVHPGWGDALFLPELLPGVPIVTYAEFFYRSNGADLGHDAELEADLDQRAALALRNAPLLLALEAAAAAIAPTRWQRDLHPAAYRPRITVIHEGVDTDRVRPDPAARFALPDAGELTRADEVVTYVARDLEPHRGFPALMRALPALLAARPAARVVICGGDGVSYGRRPPGGGSWREAMIAEIGGLPPRVHFTGPLPYDAYLRLLQVSRLHLYPSAPFVLSWSLTEALAAGCLVLGADVAPVREVIRDGRNGFLVDARDAAAFAARAASLLAQSERLAGVRRAARATVLARFARASAIERQCALLRRIAARPG